MYCADGRRRNSGDGTCHNSPRAPLIRLAASPRGGCRAASWSRSSKKAGRAEGVTSGPEVSAGAFRAAQSVQACALRPPAVADRCFRVAATSVRSEGMFQMAERALFNAPENFRCPSTFFLRPCRNFPCCGKLSFNVPENRGQKTAFSSGERGRGRACNVRILYLYSAVSKSNHAAMEPQGRPQRQCRRRASGVSDPGKEDCRKALQGRSADAASGGCDISEEQVLTKESERELSRP